VRVGLLGTTNRLGFMLSEAAQGGLWPRGEATSPASPPAGAAPRLRHDRSVCAFAPWEQLAVEAARCGSGALWERLAVGAARC